MLALTFRNRDGQPLSPALLAAIAGITQGHFGYTAELVEVPDSNQGTKMKRLLSFFAFVFFALVGAVAFAQSAASLPADLPGVIGWFKETHSGGNWSLMIGGSLTLFLRFAPVVKPWLDKLPDEATKWVAAALAMLGSVATGLMAGVVWYKVLLDGAQVAVATVGGWELVLKPLLNKIGLQKASA